MLVEDRSSDIMPDFPNIDMNDAVSIEPCGCQSRVVINPQTRERGRSITPCEGHALLRAAENFVEAAKMLAHFANLTLNKKRS